jgi:hypothetical protein
MKTLLIFLWQRGFRLFKNDTNATPVKGWFLNVESRYVKSMSWHPLERRMPGHESNFLSCHSKCFLALFERWTIISGHF